MTLISLNTFGQRFSFYLNESQYQITTSKMLYSGGEYDYYSLKKVSTDRKVKSRVCYVRIVNVKIEEISNIYVDQKHTSFIQINETYFVMFFQLKNSEQNFLSIIEITENGEMEELISNYFDADIPKTITRYKDHYSIDTEPIIYLYFNQCYHGMWSNCGITSECLPNRWHFTVYSEDNNIHENDCK